MSLSIIHVHSEHSLKDSPMQIKDLVKQAKKIGCENLTLTDHGTCTGWIEFLSECKKEGINGIPGVELYVETPYAPHAHMLVLARNYEGYKKISRLVSLSNNNLVNIGGNPAPVCRMEDLSMIAGTDVIVTSACVAGVLGSVLLKNQSLMQQTEKLNKRKEKVLLKLPKHYNESVEEEKNLAKKLDELQRKKDAIEKIANKKYSKRKKGLNVLEKDSDAYKQAAASLAKEIQETEDAKVELALLKENIRTVKRTKSTLHKQNETQKTYRQKANAYEYEIKKLREQMVPAQTLIKETESFMLQLKELFSYFFVELQYHGLPDEKKVMPVLASLAIRNRIPLVAANDAHITTKEQAEARAALHALRFDRYFAPSESDKELYLKTNEELSASLSSILHADIVSYAISNTDWIGNNCKVVIPDTPHYPKYRDASGLSSAAILEKKALEGKERRFPNGWSSEYDDRLSYELKTIIDMGFADYLLIVQDFIQYAKAYSKSLNEEGIGYGVGPGRGSGAGSLVNYLLGITELDPIAYGLLFERFLNKDRVSMPDIDTDFSDEVRGATIEYVKEKYGSDTVAFIRTSMTQGARSSLKNASRVVGYELYGPKYGADANWKKLTDQILNLGDQMAKVVPEKPGVSIHDVLPELENKFTDGISKRIREFALGIENTMFTTSVHAAGVVIGDGTPLRDIVPLLYNTSKNQWAIQCDMVEAEHDLKLLKMDFLGLNNLDVITDTLRLVYENHGVKEDMDHLPFLPEVFSEIFSKGNTGCVFQFESDGMKKMLRQFQPSSFEDIILLVAAYRPGPMEFIPKIIRVKQGEEKPYYCVPELKEILSATYGYPIYQEQLMEIFHTCAGFSLGEADIIRRHMSKKHVEEFLAYKPQFISGLIAHGASEEDANSLWDSLEGFAKYAFNKSHAACYAKISYMTAYLKWKYPAEYMCAILNHADVKKMPALIAECKKMKLTIRTPDINRSGADFTTGNGEILFGLSKIKGFNSATAEAIVEERKNGKYDSPWNFMLRIKTSESLLNSLIYSGAFDLFTKNRERLYLTLTGHLKDVEKVRKKAEKMRKDEAEYEKTLKELEMQSHSIKLRNTVMRSIPVDEEIRNAVLEVHGNELQKISQKKHAILTSYEVKKKKEEESVNALCNALYEIPLPKDEETDGMKELLLENELLGAFVSRHPVTEYQKKGTKIADMKPGNVMTVGIIREFREFRDKNGRMMAAGALEDDTGTIRFLLFSRQYQDYKEFLKPDTVVAVSGKAEFETSKDESGPMLIISGFAVCRKRKPYILAYTKELQPNKFLEYFTKFADKDGYPLLICSMVYAKDGHPLVSDTQLTVKKSILHAGTDEVQFLLLPQSEDILEPFDPNGESRRLKIAPIKKEYIVE